MLTKSVVLSSLAALALAEAAVEPRVTQAPVRRQTFGDAGDDIDDFLDGAGTRVDDLIDGAGSGVDEIISRASTAAGGVAGDVSTFLSDLGGDVSAASACASLFSSLEGSMPTPTGDFLEAMASDGVEGLETDVCKLAEDLEDDEQKEQWESFRSSASSWYADNSEAVSSAIDACPTGLHIEDLVKELDCITGESSGSSDGDDEDAATRVAGLAMAVAGAAVGVVAVML